MWIQLSDDQIKQLYGGRSIYDVAPKLTPDEKEFVASRICPSCTDNQYSEGIEQEIEIIQIEECHPEEYLG